MAIAIAFEVFFLGLAVSCGLWALRAEGNNKSYAISGMIASAFLFVLFGLLLVLQGWSGE